MPARITTTSEDSRQESDETAQGSSGIRYTRVLGAELRYFRAGSGPTVVLVHTLRTQLEYWERLLRALGSGIEVVALDLPGHGRSTAPPTDYTAAYFTEATSQLLDACDLRDVILVGESIGGAIALGLAAAGNPRLARIVSINPYDYGRGGGVRRSSALANVLFTTFQWPVVGPLVLRMGTKGILRRVLQGGLRDRRKLPPDLLDQVWRCGSLPGHAQAFLSLCREWRSWIEARGAYADVKIPVTLVYSDHDWSRPEERETNARALPTARIVSLAECGHFASLERPEQVAGLILEELS